MAKKNGFEILGYGLCLTIGAVGVAIVSALAFALIGWLAWTCSGFGEAYLSFLPEQWERPTFGAMFCICLIGIFARGVIGSTVRYSSKDIPD